MRRIIQFEKQHDQAPNTYDFGGDTEGYRYPGRGNVQEKKALTFLKYSRPPTSKYHADVFKTYYRKRPTMEKIVEKFYGVGTTGYMIQDLRIYRGTKSTIGPGPLFHQYIVHSYVKDYLPQRARKNIKKGPRNAVRKCGPH